MVTKRPKGLGRGLEALLGPTFDENAANHAANLAAAKAAEMANPGSPSTLMLTDMVAGQYQPRTRMDEGALYELAESIKVQGITIRIGAADHTDRMHSIGAEISAMASPRGQDVTKPREPLLAWIMQFLVQQMLSLPKEPLMKALTFNTAWSRCSGWARGLPIATLAAGAWVLVSGSRAHLPLAQQRYPGLSAVHVHASASVLRQRLRARQRESNAEVEARLHRALAFDAPADAFCLTNDEDLESAGQRLKAHLFSPAPPRDGAQAETQLSRQVT